MLELPVPVWIANLVEFEQWRGGLWGGETELDRL
jgi:hypothetical protein